MQWYEYYCCIKKSSKILVPFCVIQFSRGARPLQCPTSSSFIQVCTWSTIHGIKIILWQQAEARQSTSPHLTHCREVDLWRLVDFHPGNRCLGERLVLDSERTKMSASGSEEALRQRGVKSRRPAGIFFDIEVLVNVPFEQGCLRLSVWIRLLPLKTTTMDASNVYSFAILDSKFKQQRLAAWRPILTPASVLPWFGLVGVAFIITGAILLAENKDVLCRHCLWSFTFYCG